MATHSYKHNAKNTLSQQHDRRMKCVEREKQTTPTCKTAAKDYGVGESGCMLRRGRGAHAEMHPRVSACTRCWLLSGLAKEAQWSMCSLTPRGGEGGSQAVPSSWVIFNQQYYHASQKDLQPAHPPPPKKSHPHTSLKLHTKLSAQFKH